MPHSKWNPKTISFLEELKRIASFKNSTITNFKRFAGKYVNRDASLKVTNPSEVPFEAILKKQFY